MVVGWVGFQVPKYETKKKTKKQTLSRFLFILSYGTDSFYWHGKEVPHHEIVVYL